MVATFSWVEYNANATDTAVPTNLNLGSTNARNLAPSTYPITAGTYSYSKWARGLWSGSFSEISALKFWMSASGTGYVTGETLWFSGTTGTYAGTGTFSTPTTGLDAEAPNAMVVTAATANIGFAGSLTETIGAGGYSDFIVIQASITSAASPGAVQQKTFTLQYTEV